MPTRRAYGTGGITRKHETRFGCPPADRVDGHWLRPDHTCTAPWVGTIELGWNQRGNRRRMTVVSKTKPGVQTKLRNALRDAKEGDLPVVGGKPTVKVWAEQWLTITQRKIRPTSWQANASQTLNWIVPTIGQRRLEALRPADVRAVERAMELAGKSPATISRCMSVLTKMLKDAIVEGHPVPQSVLMVETTSAGENDRDAIPLDDAIALLATAATQLDGSRWVAALLLGMRPAECLGLTWDCVNLEQGEVDVSWQLKRLPYVTAGDPTSGYRVPRGYVTRQAYKALHLVRPKTAAGRRIISLDSWTRSSLIAWRDVCPTTPLGLVWPTIPSRQSDGQARPRSDHQDRAAWVALQDAARVAHVDGTIGRRYALYEARHTAATMLRVLGNDDPTITGIMGHASILSTKAYLHTDPIRMATAIQDAASRLGLPAALPMKEN